jgi:hypothetical protein
MEPVTCACESGECALRPTGHVEGFVTQDGQPAGGVHVQLQTFAHLAAFKPEWDHCAPPMAAPWGPVFTTSDGQGRFSFSSLRRGWRFAIAGDVARSAGRAVEPTDTGPLRLELSPPGSLQIRVVDPGGRAVDGAEVRVVDAVSEYGTAARALFAARANALGGGSEGAVRWTLGKAARSVAPAVFRAEQLYAVPWWITVRAPGFVPVEFAQEVEPGRERQVEVTLTAAGIVEGSVRDETGHPIAGAAIGLRDAGGAPPARPREPRTPGELVALIYQSAKDLDGPAPPQRTDALGRFRFDDRAPGRYTLRVDGMVTHLPGVAPRATDRRSDDSDLDGRSMPGALGLARGIDLVTERTAEFHGREGFFRVERAITAPEQNLSIAVTHAAHVRVRVTDPSGAAVPARIRAAPSPRCSLGPDVGAADPKVWFAAPRGALVVGPLEACPHELEVDASGFTPARFSVTPSPTEVSEVLAVLKPR